MALPCMLHLAPRTCSLHLRSFIPSPSVTFNMPEPAPDVPSSPKSRYSKHIIVGYLEAEQEGCGDADRVVVDDVSRPKRD